MARGEKITQVITNNKDLAIGFLRHFLSNGERFGDFWKVGNFQNKKGTGADGGSTAIKIPELCGSDKATGDKTNGPIKIIRLLKDCTAPEAEEIIIEWLSREGVEIEGLESKGKKESSEAAFPWSTAVQGLTEDDLKELRGFRGYPAELCQRIKSLELIAKVDGRWAFPVRNKSGVIVAVDRLTAHPDLDLNAKKQSWQPKPVGAPRDESWFFIGADPKKATKLIVPESRWDALSILPLFTDAELQTISIISALGVSQISLPLSPTVTEIICAAQNDTASKQWAAKLAPQCRNKTFKLVLPPSEYKDYNDALRKGLLSRDIFDNAKPCTYNFSTGQLSEDFRPIYEIYGGPIESIPALENGIKILADSGEVFDVGGMPMWLQVAKKPQQLDIEADRFDFNLVMQKFAQTFYVSIGEKGGLEYRKAPLGVKAVGLLMGNWNRAETKLSPVSKILATPNLVRKSGNLELPKPGYHPDCDGGPIFIVNQGRPIPEIGFEEGRKNLLELISEFDFLTENDISRMIAFMIAPAMQSAGFLQRWYPLAYFEAQEQGSGKSSLMEIIPAIYGEDFASVAPPPDKSGGVGSLDNSVSAALGLRMRFLCIDNMRGPIKSTLMETALTSGRVQIRSAYCAEREINCDGVIWMITSNNSTMTPDLMERSLTVKLRGKPPQGWKRNKVEQMALIRERQPELLGSVYAMIREWYKAGSPVKSESRHRFSNWAHPMCGLVEAVMGLPEILGGIELDTRRLTDEDFAWARNMGIRLQKEYELVGNNGSSQRVNMLNKDLFAKDLVEVSMARDLYPPGVNRNSDEIDIVRSIGTVISRLAKQGNALDLGGFRLLTRMGEEKKLDKKGRSRGTNKRWIARWEEV